MQRIRLAPDYEISRVIRGGWQLASGHGAVKSDDPVADMVAFADAGITTFDCADIYTGVEELIGRFRLRYRDLRGEEALGRIKVHTKFVPDLDVLKHINKSYVEGVIDQSLRRLKLERLDLVQFHWWDYAAPRWLETAQWLNELRLAGKIHKVSATNFDTDRMLHMVERRRAADLDAGAVFAARRAAGQAHGRRLRPRTASRCSATARSPAASSATAGSAQPEPQDRSRTARSPNTSSSSTISAAGTCSRRCSRRCAQIADRHGVDIATVASAAMLTRPAVAAVIVGARNRSHLAVQPRHLRASRSTPERSRPRSTRCWPRRATSTATSTRWSATATAATARS